ncbi:vacuolar aminopeptidase 1 [Trichomonascus vanleenenianus]|uniref:M18 family aminopeptidase n=1 Tax=Trichomonascus vanleenenianus TaxID=2268995 RepID=UPI003ECB725B
MGSTDDKGIEKSMDFIDFNYENPTVFHACNYFLNLLKTNNFKYLSGRDVWDNQLKPGGKYVTTRNGSSLVAFEIGKNWKAGQGIGIVGCHIDANTVRLKPISKKEPVDGFRQLGAAPYGGGLGPTWWDRDLSIGGRLILYSSEKKQYSSELVQIKRPIARIPTLAPHFGKDAEGPFNKETQMTPVIGLMTEDEESPTDEERKCPIIDRHDIKLLRALAKEAEVEVADIRQVELELFDVQRGAIGGLDREFMFCSRLDDKLCSYAAVQGLIKTAGSSPDSINMVALFDDEEIGSLLRQGARGGLFESVVERINAQFDGDDELLRLTYANSFFVSSDVTHGVNPNFTNSYLEHHKPKLNYGMVVKLDPNGHTTSDSISTALIEQIAKKSSNKLQYFHIRNDSRSGGTIGPYLSSATGMRAVDLGIPQLSMHSIREATGSQDVYLGIEMFKAFYSSWYGVDQQFKHGDL